VKRDLLLESHQIIIVEVWLIQMVRRFEPEWVAEFEEYLGTRRFRKDHGVSPYFWVSFFWQIFGRARFSFEKIQGFPTMFIIETNQASFHRSLVDFPYFAKFAENRLQLTQI
jgi:hypothetical protein